MVKIQDLRIGNVVMTDNSDWFTPEYDKKSLVVTTELMSDLLLIGDEIGGCGSYSYSKITRELLEKLYFECQDWAKRHSFEFCEKTMLLYIDDNFIELPSENGYDCVRIENIKFLHQLQNLCQSVWGVELLDIVAFNYYLQQKTNIGIIKYSFEEFISSETTCISNDYAFKSLPPNLFL